MVFLPPYSSFSICKMCGNDGRNGYRSIDLMFSSQHSSDGYHWVGWARRCSWWCKYRHGDHIHRQCQNCKYSWLETTYQDAILESLCRTATTRTLTAEIPVAKSRRTRPQTDCDWCHDKPSTYWLPTVDTKKRKITKECFVCSDCLKNFKEA